MMKNFNLFPRLLMLSGLLIMVGYSSSIAEVWDPSCGRSIQSLKSTQERIQTLRGQQVAHELYRFSSDLKVMEDDLTKLSDDQEKNLLKLIQEFNHRLKEFANTCLKNPVI